MVHGMRTLLCSAITRLSKDSLCMVTRCANTHLPLTTSKESINIGWSISGPLYIYTTANTWYMYNLMYMYSY